MADITKHKLSQSEKDANDKEWYKAKIREVGSMLSSTSVGFGDINETKRKQVNYDLFNNKINLADFDYVCKPYGSSDVGELPADLTNRDIISGKIKTLLGMEMKRPFSWKVVAVNEEATTRKEQEEFGMFKDFVIQQIMTPIQQELQEQAAAEGKDRELTEDDKAQIQQRIAEELKAKTPKEIKKYMAREHQDPAEALAHQILEYLIQQEEIRTKFNKAFKHSLIAGEEFYYVGIQNGHPVLKVVNPIGFEYDKSPDLDYIEDGEWCSAEYNMTPSQILAMFGTSLTDDDLEAIFSRDVNGGIGFTDANLDWSFDGNEDNNHTIRVYHRQWKALRRIGFLTYLDEETGEELEEMVGEEYTLNEDSGDISIEWIWIPEVHEGYLIGGDIFPMDFLGPVPGQMLDLDDIYKCKLSYMGGVYDNLNSETTSILDRMKAYQYYYNIIMYRVELMMASDKGKILLMNINSIPKSQGIDMKKWLYYAESMKIGWINPNEEGNRNTDTTNVAKEIDMSLASNIQQYIALAEYIEAQCGNSVGITKAMEGQIGPNDAVANTRQSITQSSHILEPYFEHHNNIKKNVLQRIIDVAKVAYAESQPKKLSYILDDMSLSLITMDYDLLDNSNYGIFVSNSSKAHEAKELIGQLAHAALQNQQIQLSDVIKVVRADGVQEAEEMLVASEQATREQAMEAESQKQNALAEAAEKERNFKREEWDREDQQIIIKAEEDRKTNVQTATIEALSYNEDKDLDKDGTPDVLEVAKHNFDANIAIRKQNLDEKKFDQQVKQDKKKNELEEKKLKQKPKK